MIQYFGYCHLNWFYRCLILIFYLFFSALVLADEPVGNSDSSLNQQAVINNSSLQKMFTRVEILQRINQDLRNRLEKLEISNQSLSTRLEELSVEFDLRLETLKYEFSQFKEQINQKLNTLTADQKEEKLPKQEDSIVIDFATQDIYRQGIMAISLEDYQEAIEALKQFINQVDPKASHLITKAKFWIAISELKLKNYAQSFELFFELEQVNNNTSQENQIINFNLIKQGLIQSLIGLNETDKARQLIKKYLSFGDEELTSLMQEVQSELE